MQRLATRTMSGLLRMTRLVPPHPRRRCRNHAHQTRAACGGSQQCRSASPLLMQGPARRARLEALSWGRGASSEAQCTLQALQSRRHLQMPECSLPAASLGSLPPGPAARLPRSVNSNCPPPLACCPSPAPRFSNQFPQTRCARPLLAIPTHPLPLSLPPSLPPAPSTIPHLLCFTLPSTPPPAQLADPLQPPAPRCLHACDIVASR